jgi:Exopolyphosphatase-related proteins
MSTEHGDGQYRRQLADAARFIREHDDFLVVSHIHPDGDAVGSTCAVGWILDQLGKRNMLCNEGAIPKKYRFLRRGDQIADYAGHRPDKMYRHVICVDCADYQRIGSIAEWIAEDAQIVNIDHHPTNDRYGAVHVVKEDAAATAELLFDLAEELALPLTAEMAECIYTGILTDTGGFRYANTSPRVMQIASRLLTYGISPGMLAEVLLEKTTFAHILLLKKALTTLSFTEDRRIAWVCAWKKDIEEAGAGNEDMDGLVNYPRNIEGVEVGLLFKQMSDREVKVSFRASSRVDVSRVAQQFGGGGHVRAAGATIRGDMDEVVARVVEATRLALP